MFAKVLTVCMTCLSTSSSSRSCCIMAIVRYIDMEIASNVLQSTPRVCAVSGVLRHFIVALQYRSWTLLLADTHTQTHCSLARASTSSPSSTSIGSIFSGSFGKLNHFRFHRCCCSIITSRPASCNDWLMARVFSHLLPAFWAWLLREEQPGLDTSCVWPIGTAVTQLHLVITYLLVGSALPLRGWFMLHVRLS